MNNTFIENLSTNSHDYCAELPPEIAVIIIDKIVETSETAQQRFQTLASLSQSNQSFKSLTEQKVIEVKKELLEAKKIEKQNLDDNSEDEIRNFVRLRLERVMNLPQIIDFDDIQQRLIVRVVEKPSLIQRIVQFVQAVFTYIARQIAIFFSECHQNIMNFYQQASMGLNLMNLRV